jgi:uncharacterized protein YjiS (DUF1127 family)
MSTTTAPAATRDTFMASPSAVSGLLRRPVWHRIVSTAARCVLVMRELQRLRRAERELQELDDRMLKDIGLTRPEIGAIVRQRRDGRTKISQGTWA